MSQPKELFPDVLSSIRMNYNALSIVQKKIADYVQANAKTVMFLSITDLAEKCSTSETTIMRFLRKIGYDSFQVFRVRIAQSSQPEDTKYAVSDISLSDSTREISDKVISSTMTAISDVHQLISDIEFDETVEKILAARRILVFGSGASGYIAGDLYHKLVRLGFDALVCTDSHLMSIHSAMAQPDDLMILVSHSGETKTILSCAEEGLNRHCNLLSLCSYQHSSLVEKTKLVLLSSTNETRLRPDATTSRILQLVIIDIIVILLTKCLGQDGFDAIKRSQVAVANLKK